MNNQTVNRPWGSYRSLLQADNHQVKKLVVEPGQRLSLQSHERRCEHWVVTHGPALVTVGDKEQIFNTGEHIFIPLKARHRLANPGDDPIIIIEVQLGDYLGEDDIIRYADDYQRDLKKKDLK